MSNVVEVHINSLRNKIDKDSICRSSAPCGVGHADGRTRMKLSLRLRLALTTLVLFGLLVIAVSTLTYGVLAQQLDRDTADGVTGSPMASGLSPAQRRHGVGRLRQQGRR